MRYRAEKERNEFYRTPSQAVDLAIPLMDKELSWWECCAGDGAISNRLHTTFASDLEPQADNIETLDVLNCDKPENVNAIITNPPFTLGYDIVHRALFEWGITALMLMRVEYMSGKNRLDIRKHLTKMHIVSEQIKFATSNGRVVNGNGTGRCAWFLFEPNKTPSSVETKFVLYK
jgi:hypothetical protein